MRIIAGKLRSRKLMAPEGQKTRPTSDRARESLFNVLHNMIDLDSARVLDLFAGSGALGFEAISRGATHVTFVEQDLAARRMIERNAIALGVAGHIENKRQDVVQYLSDESELFDLILSDPPYREIKLSERAIELVFDQKWLKPEGLLVVEHRTGERPVISQSAEEVRTLAAGEASFLILRHRD